MKKIIFSAILLLAVVAPAQSLAQGGSISKTQTDAFVEASEISTVSVGEVVANVIKVMLSLLGVIFLALLFYAGFLWMTAQGNESQVEKAKDIIKAAIIGLIIVAAAYSITYFVFNALGEATGSGGGNRPI